ncbi:MAG: hypothetical protein RLZZ301_329 [Bacteroidota bacterium]|jgi:1-acyl-sn-glycerol-3-phosphate acyltransferase
MRPLYFLFWNTLTLAFWAFFRKVKQINPTKKRFGRTIFVSNHPSAFLDPLVIARLRKPVVYFMTRSDIFNRVTKPLFWLAHMIPIYRQQDGGNSTEKNKKVFKKATETLAKNRNLLIFGEGLTDDVFERRLKPIKKGAIRIGFTALEDLNWSVDIQVQGLGINYTDPGKMRGDVLIAAAEPIVLNTYKDAYIENPAKVISELNRELETRMRAQITHVEQEEFCTFHEQLQMLSRKGMHPTCSDPNAPLEQRWKYAQKLALHLNSYGTELPADMRSFKEKLAIYFDKLAQQKLSEAEVYWFAVAPNWKAKMRAKILALLPFYLVALLTTFVPFLLIKRFVEKTFKRPVFWSSTKLGLLILGLPIWNSILFLGLSFFIDIPCLVWICLFLLIPILSVAYYQVTAAYNLLAKSRQTDAQLLATIVNEREVLCQELKRLNVL